MENDNRYDFLSHHETGTHADGDSGTLAVPQHIQNYPSPLPVWAIYFISVISILGLWGTISAGSYIPQFDSPLPLGYGLLHASVNMYAFALITMLSYIAVICAKRESMAITARIMRWISLVMAIIWCFPLLGVLNFAGENASILIISSFCLWYMWFPKMKKKLSRKFIAMETSLIGEYWENDVPTNPQSEAPDRFTGAWNTGWKTLGTIGLIFLNYCIIFQ